MADHFQNEVAFLGIETSPAFVRTPEGNGCAEVEPILHHATTRPRQPIWTAARSAMPRYGNALTASFLPALEVFHPNQESCREQARHGRFATSTATTIENLFSLAGS